ncbi:MAG: hypothetical protein KGJ06_01655 [Pseudomonadota bacterium]|nr:hypothetical protein [Pseudomonadota bacterium]
MASAQNFVQELYAKDGIAIAEQDAEKFWPKIVREIAVTNVTDQDMSVIISFTDGQKPAEARLLSPSQSACLRKRAHRGLRVSWIPLSTREEINAAAPAMRCVEVQLPPDEIW